ncbi:MAG: alginate lyase family protein, partial [Anaerolineales bacterium]|nr:alginate lyase family protein [Anaerolineales bacterium]
NNHLLVEALGLFTAGLAIPGHPQAGEWRDQGWYWIEHSLQDQIAPDGSYIQQSTNYHRLMLQAALWANCLVNSQGRNFSTVTLERLKAATLWLSVMVDKVNGNVPNLGPNDGAYIFPLSACPFDDFRPTLQAAGRAFLSGGLFPAGDWDELASWFTIPDQPANRKELERSNEQIGPKVIIRSAGSESWGYLRVANFTARPGHADQLHLDLWWRGQNVARDPGTYLYNAQPPWRNALARSSVHNVITIDQQDQMTSAGRFLWLDWAQAEVLDKKRGENGELVEVTARHNGYRGLGIEHRRTVSAHSAGIWHVADEILYIYGLQANNNHPATHKVCLRWQLPDWEWLVEADSPDNYCLVLKSPYGKIQLRVYLELMGERTPIQGNLTLARAGKSVYGSGTPSPEEGWYSPTYAEKVPALTLGLTATKQMPLRI